MEQVHRAHGHLERVVRRQFTCCPDRLGPAKFDVRPVPEPNLLFEQPDDLARLAVADDPRSFSLIKTVEDLNPLPGCPQDLGFRFAIKQGQSCRVMDVAPGLLSQPPGGVGVAPHFLSERRNATPSNLGALASPTARFSASGLVMRSPPGMRGASLVRPLLTEVAVFISRQDCRLLQETSSGRARATTKPNGKLTKQSDQ